MASEDCVELYDERFPKLTSGEVEIIHALEKRFPTEAAAALYVQELVRSEGILKCSKCGSDNIHCSEGARVAKCAGCNAPVWFTKDSFFEGIHKLRPALLALLLISQGVFLIASDLQKLCNIANSTAQQHLRRAELVQLEDQRDSRGVSVFTLAFIDRIGRRSTETPARKHPKFEQFELDASRTEQEIDADHVVSCTELDNDTFSVLKALRDKRLTMDSLCLATGVPISKLSVIVVTLELDGKVRRLPGDQYEWIMPSISFLHDDSQIAQIQDLIDEFNKLLSKRSQCVSRKYIELYLVAYWRFLQQATGSSETDEIIRKCISRRVTGKNIRQFVSAASVNMPSFAA